MAARRWTVLPFAILAVLLFSAIAGANATLAAALPGPLALLAAAIAVVSVWCVVVIILGIWDWFTDEQD